MSDIAIANYGSAKEVATLLNQVNHHAAQDLILPALINALNRIATLEADVMRLHNQVHQERP